MKKFLILVLIGILFSNNLIHDSEARISLKKSDEIRCTNIYEKFVKMGENNFRERYPAYPIMDKCMRLFYDPEWNFKDKDMIEKKYSSNLLSKVFVSDSKSQSDSKILSQLKIGPEKFLIKFSICNESNPTIYLLITTDKEQVIGKIYQPFTESCPILMTQIKATNPDDTQFSWYYDSLNSSQQTSEVLKPIK